MRYFIVYTLTSFTDRTIPSNWTFARSSTTFSTIFAWNTAEIWKSNRLPTSQNLQKSLNFIHDYILITLESFSKDDADAKDDVPRMAWEWHENGVRMAWHIHKWAHARHFHVVFDVGVVFAKALYRITILKANKWILYFHTPQQIWRCYGTARNALYAFFKKPNFLKKGALVAQSSGQAPFTSEIVGS